MQRWISISVLYSGFSGSECSALEDNVDVHALFDLKMLFFPPPFHLVDTVEAALAMDPEAFKAKYGVSKPQFEAPELVFHCYMGGRGGRATEAARKLGYVK